MRTFKLIFVCTVLATLFCQACDPCLNAEGCSDSFRFRIVRAGSHDDLVFGPDSIYHKDSISLFTNLPYLSGHPVSYYDSTGFQSALLLPIDTFFLKISDSDTDTVLMHYRFIKTRCCKMSSRGYGQITGIQYNGISAKKEGDTYLFEK